MLAASWPLQGVLGHTAEQLHYFQAPKNALGA